MQNRFWIMLSLCVSLAALAMSTYAILVRSNEKVIADRVSEQLLHDAWAETEPVLKDFSVKCSKPKTFREFFALLSAIGEPGVADAPTTQASP
jgi:hypothetical protein